MTLSALSLLALRMKVGLLPMLLAALLSGGLTVSCAGESTTTPAQPPTEASPRTTADGASSPAPPTATAPPSTSSAARGERPSLPPAPTVAGVSPMLPGAAPDFEIKLFQGEDILGSDELRLSDVTGKPLVLNFWARFCGPCWSEMPDLQDFYEEHGDEVQLLGVDLGQFTGLGLPKDASKLLDALGITYPAGYTDDAHVVRDYSVRAMPTTIFITAEGEVFQSWTGSIEREQLEAVVAAMLKGE